MKGAEVLTRRKTSDGISIQLWTDGTLTAGLGVVIKGSPNARTPDQVKAALAIGRLVMGDVELYERDEVPTLIAAARKVAARGGTPGEMREVITKGERPKIHPVWTTQETDRDGRPTLRVWRLPRLTHPGLAIWNEVRGSRGRGRYQVMKEIGNSGTYAPTGVQFHDLDKLAEYLHDTSKLAR